MSLIIKISQNGSSQEYIFNKLGPILIGSDKRCDLHIDDPHIEPKLLEVKVSAGNIFVKEVGARAEIYLDSVILPFREDLRYHEGSILTLKNTHYQITISKPQAEVIEPPPFFDGEFKERLDRMSFKIREKESELKNLDQKEEKKKLQIMDLEDKYHKFANEKGKLEVEVTALKSQKDHLSHEIRKTTVKNQDTEAKILQLKDFVQKLELEEQTLKETIVAQNLVLANLREEREKKSKDVDKQRLLLANLELDTLKAQEELNELEAVYQNKEEEIGLETNKVQRILESSQEALKERAKIQGQIADALKEKTVLDHEVLELDTNVKKLEAQRKDSTAKLQQIKFEIEREEGNFLKLKDEIRTKEDERTSLVIMNGELKSELSKAEEKLSSRKNLLNQIEFEHQDKTRKLSTISFEVERSGLRLKELISEEKAQELKVLALREEFAQFSRKNAEDRKHIQKEFQDENQKYEIQLDGIRKEIEAENKALAKLESQQLVIRTSIEELQAALKSLQKDKTETEYQVEELRKQREQSESHLFQIKADTQKVTHEKERALRELNTIQLKLVDCENQIKESLEASRVEVENYKREERAKIQSEKEVYLAEIETFRQKSLSEVENEYRRKENDLHQLKSIAQREADQLLEEARQKEAYLTLEATERLRLASKEADQREKASHERVQEAQAYFKEKEKEAEALIQKARLDSRELMRKSELEIQEDFAKRKTKIKKFLTMKQETGLLHIKQLTEQHLQKLIKLESRAHEKLEETRRKELKKVARIRSDELDRHQAMKDVALQEVKVFKEKSLREISDMKKQQEAELAEKKKYMLDHINQTKFKTQKGWEEEIRRERDKFEQTKKDRIQNAAQAVMNVFISEYGQLGEKENTLKDRIKTNLEMAIDGQNANALKEVDQILDFNPTNRKKVLPVLKKYALRFGVPAAVASILLADVGNLRTSAVDLAKDLIKQQQSASEKYVNQQKTEWKEKHTYTPVQTAGYKASYVDNVIFTPDFEAVMENEEFQNDWILKVHDYMVKDLELSEDVAINFISSEGTLIKELSTARKDLHPQFLDVGMKKMRDLEVTHLGWLNEKIPDQLKMEKFNGFKKDYYEKFYAEKFHPQRSIAGENKQP